MTGQPTTAEEPAEDRQRSFWASFNRADAKFFLVTSAGTLIGNVGLVLIVALGLLVAHKVNHYHNGFKTLIVVTILLPLIALVVGGVTFAAARSLKSRPLIWVAVVVLTVPYLGFAVLLLAIIGYATGVK